MDTALPSEKGRPFQMQQAFINMITGETEEEVRNSKPLSLRDLVCPPMISKLQRTTPAMPPQRSARLRTPTPIPMIVCAASCSNTFSLVSYR